MGEAKKRSPLKIEVPKRASRAYVHFIHEQVPLSNLYIEHLRKKAQLWTDVTNDLQDAISRINSGNFSKTERKRRDFHTPEILKEAVFVRLVDNYLVYLQDICLLIYDQRPELIGKIEIRPADVMNYTDVSELAAYIRSEATKSISKLQRDALFSVLKKAGLESVKGQRGLASIGSALELRDVITPRRGLMGSRLVLDSDELWKFGEAVRQYESRHGEFIFLMHNSVVEIDQEAIEQFSLQSKEVASKLSIKD